MLLMINVGQCNQRKYKKLANINVKINTIDLEKTADEWIAATLDMVNPYDESIE